MSQLPLQDVRPTPVAPWWQRRAEWLYASLRAGEMEDHDAMVETRHPVTIETIGQLDLPGGLFVAADPYVMGGDADPFAQRLGAERADVVAARALVGPDHERVAALVLWCGTDAVVEWRMATVGDQDVGSLEEEGFFGYGVDAGTGSFGSPDAMQVTGTVLAEDAGMLEDPVSAALFADSVGTRSAVLVAPAEGAAPVAVCSSGWGDGVYPTWLGTDGAGAVVVAVTDFLLVGDPYAAPVQPEAEPLDAEAGARPGLLRRLFGG